MSRLLSPTRKIHVPPFVGLNVSVELQTNPLAAADAVRLVKSAFPNVNHMKLFDWKSDLLEALVAAGYLDIVVSVTNCELAAVASPDGAAAAAIATRLAPVVLQGVHITIAVGNEPLSPMDNGKFADHVIPALQQMRKALDALGECDVNLTVPFDALILSSSYPPQTAAFKPDTEGIVAAVANILRDAGSPFFVNFYPYFAYLEDPVSISLDYALLETSHTVDGITYPNMLAAFVAAFRTALLRADPTLTAAALPIVIGETGWPTSGHPVATVANAKRYLANAINTGIPLYLFEAFDEGQKPFAETERNFGILTEAGINK